MALVVQELKGNKMTDQKKFKQWFKTNISDKVDTDYCSSVLLTAKADMYMGWKAAKQDSATEIAQLQADNLKLLEVIRVLKEAK